MGFESIHRNIADLTSIFFEYAKKGAAGAGKSSLANALDPDEARRTGTVRAGGARGPSWRASFYLIET